ncbi:MAG: hypothetical protein H5T99_01285 [Moorella sp. (in: Bacteria)]|nr:hypothetical protein [Moorella sp. (in: firmicutes)]
MEDRVSGKGSASRMEKKVAERKLILHLPDGRCVYIRQVAAENYWLLLSYLRKGKRRAKVRKEVRTE